MGQWVKRSELTCPCCGVNQAQTRLVQELDAARQYAGVPFIINSGYRCPRHNAEVGGSPQSSHMLGLAADISCTEMANRFKIIDALIYRGFTRLGIYETFIHADLDASKVQGVVWLGEQQK